MTADSEDGMQKMWIKFTFENCVSVAYEGVSGSPNRYRIRLRMDPGYQLTDLQCEWKTDGDKRILRLSASATEDAGVKASKSFEVLVDPACQVADDSSPAVTQHKDRGECWIEFPVAQLPADLPMASA